MTLAASLPRAALLVGLNLASALLAQPAGPIPGPAKSSGTGSPVTAPVPAEPGTVPEQKLVAQFDLDHDGRLNAAERQAARAFLAQQPGITTVTGTPPGAKTEVLAREAAKPGAEVSPSQVAIFARQPFYDGRTLRTLFLWFEDPDWEQQLADFAHTDVLVPADLMVEGQHLHGVGVHLRAEADHAPFMAGYKHSLELKVDFTHPEEDLGGEHRVQLLAADADPTLLRTVLYHRLAREMQLPLPQANFARLVINGEDWGVYVNLQPFDTPFVRQSFGPGDAAQWTVAGGGTFAYLGDDPAAYRPIYQLQTTDLSSAWNRLIALCRTLDQVPFWQRKEALEPLLDLNGTLKFLALENVLINQEGYRTHAGRYGLVLAADGRFHLVALDAESTFRFVESREVEEGPRQSPRGGRGDGPPASPEEKAKMDARLDAVAAKAVKARQYPKQAGTDLALLLSYSFVNKADANYDRKLTRDEWLGFIQSWFMVMDDEQDGCLTRDKFVTKLRNWITPPSIADGRSRQSFGKEDPASSVAQDFFAVMDLDHDGKLTRDEFVGSFRRWFDAWREPKETQLTQPAIQKGLESVLSQSVFDADRTQVKVHDSGLAAAGGPAEGGEGGRGGRRGGGGGSNLSIGGLPLLGRMGGGRGEREGGSGKSVAVYFDELDPMAGSDDVTRPLLAKLLEVPALRARYLDYVRDLAENWLIWPRLGPIAKEYHDLIADELKQETHKPFSYERSVQDLDQDVVTDPNEPVSIKSFIVQRRAYLLKDPKVSIPSPSE